MMLTLKQELRHVEDAGGSIYFSSLFQHFKCVFCQYCPTRLPTWQCKNGHLLCAECNSYYRYCHTCGVYTWEVMTRSLLVQNILGLAAKHCQFARNGCKTLITELNQQEKEECHYREYRCIFRHCTEEITLQSLMDHIQIIIPKHSNLRFPSGQDQTMSQGSVFFHLSWDIYLKGNSCKKWDRVDVLKLREHTMFFMGNAISGTRKAVFWVYYMGLPKEANKFGFKLTLYNKNSENVMEVTGPVVSIDNRHYLMNNHPLAFKITFGEIKNFWKQEQIKLIWKIEVFEDKSSELKNEISVNNFYK